MGVRGLTSLVAKNSLGKRVTYELQWPLKEVAERRALIVDGSALFYHVFFQSGDWIHGGNFAKFVAYLRAYIHVLRAAGFELHVLVDGGIPDAKLDTINSREAEKIRRIVKTQRAVLADDGSYRAMDGFMPPLAYFAAIEVFREENVWFRVCWAEADGLIANLARQKDALVLSKDSDFFIFDAPGYMPLYDLEIPRALLNMFWGSAIEPEAVFNVNAVVFVPSEIASFMSFDVKFLPLLAALTGNDYEQVVDNVDKYILASNPTLSNLSPHDRIREVAGLLAKQTEAEVSVEEASRNVADLIAGENEEVRGLIFESTSNAARHYALQEFEDFDASANVFPGSDKATTEQDRLVLAAFEQGLLPCTLANLLTANRIMCSVRLSVVDAHSPWISTRAIRLFIAQQLALMAPELFDSEKRLEEYIRRGYNFKSEMVGYSHAEIAMLHTSYGSLPADNCAVFGPLEERKRVFSLLCHAPATESSVIDPVLYAAFKLMIHACSVNRSSYAPKIADYEVAALVMSTLYAADAAAILKPQVPAGQPVKKTTHKTTYSPRGIHRSAYWQNCLEHVWMLAETLRLDSHPDGKWIGEGDGCFDLSLLASAYHGPLFHHLMERFKGGATPASILKMAGLDATLFEKAIQIVSEGSEEDIEKVFVEKTKKKKNKDKSTAEKSALKMQNLFDLLGDGCDF